MENTNFEHFNTQKDVNFWDHTFIHDLRPENLPKSTQKDVNLEQNALIDPCKIATNKESIYFN